MGKKKSIVKKSVEGHLTQPSIRKKRKSKLKMKLLKEVIKQDVSNDLPTRGHRQKKKNRKCQSSTVDDSKAKKQTMSKVDYKSTKGSKPNFGAVSSDSELEPINDDWCLGERSSDVDSKNGWNSENSSHDDDDDDEVAETQQPDLELSSDLVESETDEDEELDESELNSLMFDKATSDEIDRKHLSSESRSTNKRGNSSKQNKKHKEKKDSLETEKPPAPSRITNHPSERIQSFGTDVDILEEVKHRTADLTSRSLYLTPIPSHCTINMLKQLSPDIVSCRLSYNPITKTCRKYAFLEYPDPTCAQSARKAIMGRLFAGQSVSVHPSHLPSNASSIESVDFCQLFISGVSITVTKSDLQRIFPKADIEYPHHSNGFPLGYATAKFVNRDVAQEAFFQTHKLSLKGSSLFVNFLLKPVSRVKEIANRKQLEVNNLVVNKNEPSVCKPCMPTSTSDDIGSSSTTSTKTFMEKPTGSKVIVRPLIDVKSESDNDSEENDFDVMKNNKTDEFPNHRSLPVCKVSKNSQDSTILSSIVQQRKKRAGDLLGNSILDASFSDGENEDQSISTDSPGDHSDTDEDDVDEMSTDEDADDDSEGSEEASEDGASSATNDSTVEKLDEDLTNIQKMYDNSSLFEDIPSKKELAALSEPVDSTDEDIDKVLLGVIRARKSAAKAIKTAGTKTKGSGVPSGAKRTAQLLPVPTKKQKTR